MLVMTQGIIQALVMTSMLFSVLTQILNNEVQENNFSYDFNVTAFVANFKSKIIQLNITLLKPATSIYSIEISTVTNDSDEFCRQLNECSRNIDKYSITTILPFDDEPNDSCEFQNDCTYNVSIHSLFNKQINQNVIYHVPECIETLCACRHATNLPTPIFTTKIINNKELQIDWEIDSNNLKPLPDKIHLNNLFIKFVELIDCEDNSNSDPTYYSEQLEAYDGKLRLKGDFMKMFNHDLSGDCIFIEMKVIDTKECFGEISSEIVKIEKSISVHEKNNLTIQIILISTLCILVIFSLILLIIYGKQHENEIDIPPSAIKEIGKEIGRGAFGQVYLARLGEIPGRFSSQFVAIKKLNRQPNPELLEEFLKEIATMRKAGTNRNIVQLLGSSIVDKCLVMIMEFVPCGDLQKYLRNVRAKHEASLKLQMCGANTTSFNKSSTNYISQFNTPDSIEMTSFNSELQPMIPSLEYVVDHNELINFALQISRGMKHLEEKNITHRDLAARNILIDGNKTLKISDFGLARDGIYYNNKNKKVPLRWLSIEAINQNLFSNKSDVWSFAIVLWEIGTLGGFPYASLQNSEVVEFLVEGKRLEKPEICSDELYDLMLACWQTKPDDRPNFSEICDRLDSRTNRIYINFSELSPYYVFPTTVERMFKK